jgi:hypothetical protein
MKKILLLVLLFCCWGLTQAQAITGYVYDEPEKKPLEGAFVYLDGTTISTRTDRNGFFELKAPDRINALLVVNFVGFERYLLENPFNTQSPLSIYLKEKVIELQELVINKRQFFTRKQLLRAFKDQFLGQTANGSSCVIENEQDIILSYDVPGNVLTAQAVKPLVIINEKLGYRVVFDLAEFKTVYKLRSVKNIDVSSSFFAGTSAFIDISGKDGVGEKRKKAYIASPIHFMRTVASENWEKEGFVLYDDKFPVSPKEYFKVTDTLNIKKVKVTFPAVKPNPGIGFTSSGNAPSELKALQKPKTLRHKKLTVLHRTKHQSFVTFDKGVLYIDENGLFAPIDEIYFGGYMGVIKAGDMLPADYKYEP